MRAMLPCLAVLALTALAHGSPARTADSAQVLEECARTGPPPKATGIVELQKSCPDLERAVLDLGLGEQLGSDWRDRITPAAVAQLAQLLQRYQGQPASAAPHIDSLPQVMRTLQRLGEHKSRWQLFKDWLSSLLRAPAQNFSWLQRLLARVSVPPVLARLLGYLIIALVLSLALWIVWRELKAAGALARRPARSPRARRRGLPSAAAADAGLALPDLEALPAWQRPAALLAALVQALHRSGRLGLERALTHRELGERGSFDDPAQRTRFARVSSLAERALYGARNLADHDSQLAQVLADGVLLHAQLRAARAPRT